jgi:formylglycine-generating enzyme required for sulfatase activity
MNVLGDYDAPALDRIAWYGGNSAVGYSGFGMVFRGAVVNTAGFSGMAYYGGVCGPRKCGGKRGNSWGLKDMIGNVSEWCSDWYGAYDLGAERFAIDPSGLKLASSRVERGSSWLGPAATCRAAFRSGDHPSIRCNIRGFRPVLLSLSSVEVTGQSVSAKANLDAREGKVVHLKEGEVAGEVYTNGLGMAFRWCPAGEFEMGSGREEQEMSKSWGWDASGELQHPVKLTRGYWMQEREVSQGDWKRVMGGGLSVEAECFLRSEREVLVGGDKPMKLRDFFAANVGENVGRYLGIEDDDYPMIYVDWEGAKAYCEEITQKERLAGRLDSGWRYALPSEAQWEYACRAGSKDAVYSGMMSVLGKCNAPVLDRIAWYGGNSAVGYPGAGIYFRGGIISSAGWEGMAYVGGVCGPRRCGDKASNDWGLKDMIGNVFEWCSDWFGEYGGSARGPVIDPIGPHQGTAKIRRGGAWDFGALACRAGCRYVADPAFRGSDLGFRVILVRTVE